jgi:putative ABC transport system permease protein
MLKNYIKIAWRNLWRSKFYTFLNITGLAIALSCCTLIYLYVSYNLSFDTYHKNASNVFRLVTELHLQKTEYDKGTSLAELNTLKTEIPEVKQAAFLIDKESFVVTNENFTKRFKEEKTVAFTSPEWFKLFSHQWISGNASSLAQPGNAVIRQNTAFKYFGKNDPIGKILLFNKKPVKIVGLIAAYPFNTDLKSDIYVSFASLIQLIPGYKADEKYLYTDWGDISSVNNGFIELRNADQKAIVESKMIALAKKHGYQDILKYYQFKLLPLKEAHFDTRYGGTVQKSLLLILTIIGLLIIAIAIFNYINITIAQQAKRAPEIATRKLLGSSSSQIFGQFIIESLITTLIAVCFAIVIVQISIPVVNNWLFYTNPFYIISYLNLYLFFGSMCIFLTLATGIYPSLLFSKVGISQLLKNNILNLKSGFGSRLMLVFQNTVSQVLIVCTIVIMMQVQFLTNTDLGFNRKSVVIIPVGEISNSQKEAFAERLKQMPAIQSFSFINNPPSSSSERGATIKFDNRQKWETWPARFAIGDSAYCKTFGLQLLYGTNIRSNQSKPEFLINETMATMLMGNKKESVIGKGLLAGEVNGIIKGVVKDFSVKSLREPIEPSIILEDNHLQTNLAVKLNGLQTSSVLSSLQKEYHQILPDEVFDFKFLDEEIGRLYNMERIQQKLIWVGALVAILLSSLGLVGLVSILSLQRTKEIGIRKVLGANIIQISIWLSNNFILMVLVSLLISTPLSLIIMNKWLQNFSYRIHVYWWIFAIAWAVSVIIAAISLGFHAVKSAVANPVKSLRSE